MFQRLVPSDRSVSVTWAVVAASRLSTAPRIAVRVRAALASASACVVVVPDATTLDRAGHPRMDLADEPERAGLGEGDRRARALEQQLAVEEPGAVIARGEGACPRRGRVRPSETGGRPVGRRHAGRTIPERDAVWLVRLGRPLDAVTDQDRHVTRQVDVAGGRAGSDTDADVEGRGGLGGPRETDARRRPRIIPAARSVLPRFKARRVETARRSIDRLPFLSSDACGPCRNGLNDDCRTANSAANRPDARRLAAR